MAHITSSDPPLVLYPPSRSRQFRERMSGCLDSLSCDCDCEFGEKVKEWCRLGGRNMIASIVAGTFVSFYPS